MFLLSFDSVEFFEHLIFLVQIVIDHFAIQTKHKLFAHHFHEPILQLVPIKPTIHFGSLSLEVLSRVYLEVVVSEYQ